MRDSISKQSSGFHMKITFTHLYTQKTPKTSDSLIKPTLNRRSNKSPEFGQISAVITRSAKTGYGVQMMTSQGEGKKLLSLHARTLTYTLTYSSWPKLPSSVSQ